MQTVVIHLPFCFVCVPRESGTGRLPPSPSSSTMEESGNNGGIWHCRPQPSTKLSIDFKVTQGAAGCSIDRIPPLPPHTLFSLRLVDHEVAAVNSSVGAPTGGTCLLWQRLGLLCVVISHYFSSTPSTHPECPEGAKGYRLWLSVLNAATHPPTAQGVKTVAIHAF
jgi:hypothetical protein